MLSVSIPCSVNTMLGKNICQLKEYCVELRSWQKLIIPDFLFSQMSKLIGSDSIIEQHWENWGEPRGK